MGMQRERLQVAKKMLERGIGIEDMMDVTGLEEECIRGLV